MKRWMLLLICLVLSNLVQASGKIWVLDIRGAIGPATSEYFKRHLKEAPSAEVTLIVLRMDTPGGLDSAMREMIQAMIASPIPIATYVSPSGARAASAGTYLLYASHIAAMAPGTNLGAATPVRIEGIGLGPEPEKKPSEEKKPSTDEDTMKHKMVNDAEAYLRSLAQIHGRNAEWAAQAVRESASLSAKDALDKGVIDLIANDLYDLLAQLQGREVKLQGRSHKLSTQGLFIELREPNWHDQFLSIITDPNIAYVLMLLGIYGIFFELYNPGGVLPGVIGGVCLLLAFLAFQVLPINFAGLALILLGMVFMVSEAFFPSFGVLGIGGIIAFALGSVILIDNDFFTGERSYGISYSLIAGLSIGTAAFFVMVMNMLLNIRSRPVVSGRESLLGAEGECLSNEEGRLRIYVRSEIWNAHSQTPLVIGQRVKVIQVNGLTLEVKEKTAEDN